MKKLLLLFPLLNLFACGGSAESPPVTKVEVTGNIYNAVAGKVALVTDESEVGRINDIVQGMPIEVTTSLTNHGALSLYDMEVTTEVEDAIFLTLESWMCYECFPHSGGGEYCNGIWEVEGGSIDAPENPVLPTCDGVASESGYCVSVFPDGIDCDSSSWKVEYTPPGSGMWTAMENITALHPGATITSTVGYANDAIDIKDDHVARWTVKDSANKTVDIKEYLFNVI